VWLLAVKDRNENGCCVMTGNMYMWIEDNTDKKECFRMDMVAVQIPCYNEAKTIEKVVKDISRGRVMLSGECFARLMQSAILW